MSDCRVVMASVFLAGVFLLAGTALGAVAQGAEGSGTAGKNYREAIKGGKGLLGYWLLQGNLQAEHGDLRLVSGKPVLATKDGPFGSPCIDLSDGNDLVIMPRKELDAPELSVEFLFSIAHLESGNRCLFGIRDGAATRFSLHYPAGERVLLMWNGSKVTRFRSNDALAEKQWYHIAMSVGPVDTRIWLNGKECVPVGDLGVVPKIAGLPFVVGAAGPGVQNEHAAIAVAHLVIYGRPLVETEILAHIEAAGWTAKTREQLVWQDCPVSILESQIGYHPRNTKRVYLRSALENPPQEFLPSEFTVLDAKTGKEVFRGEVKSWGKKWDTFWWVLDFTPLRMHGEFMVRAGQLVSSGFTTEDGIFHKTDLGVVALDQLEHRIHRGLEDKRSGLAGKYAHCPPDTRIYMDCGSPYSELQPVGTCVYALFELYELLGSEFSGKDRKRMIDLAAMGADYFVAAQRHTDDPETDGMFHHSLLVNTRDTWAGEIFTYLDTAYGVALLAKSHQFFKDRDPERAAHYLAAAKKAWGLCVRRPYHTKADRTFPEGCNAYFWNAPVGIQNTFGRCFYNILDEDWKMPDTLRTRDRLPFIQGSALLYEVTGEAKYLDKAIEFADAVVERQFTDWENPIEGCFGTFYEFEGNNEAFFHEFMQGGFWWQGNVEALNLEGLMHLLRLAPRDPRAATWHNAIRTYAGNYARRSTTLNPLGIYPVACYRDPQHGGIKYFQNTLMGSSCLYGFSAKNFMVLGDFLQDSGFQSLAIAGVNFIGGLNPGIPNEFEETAWDARSLIEGVGHSWFGPAGDLADTARGSVPNGFCAAPQFWQPTFDNFISYQTDKPRGMVNKNGGLQFNEGWILHSHAYVHAVARLESAYTLRLKALNHGEAVRAGVVVALTETCAPHGTITRAARTDENGELVITDLPTPCRGTVTLSFDGREVTRPVAVIAGGDHAIVADFAREVKVGIELPEQMAAGTKGVAMIRVENAGSRKAAVRLLLSASGLRLGKSEVEITLEAGTSREIPVAFECGRKVMPCLVRAITVGGGPVREFIETARIGSE